MRQLIDLFNTSDAKSILKDESLDAGPDELIEASENIIQEWEKLKDSNKYENHLRDVDFLNYKRLERKALKTLLFAITYKFVDQAKEIIEIFKFKIKPTIQDAERKMKLLNNWFRLYNEKHGDDEEKEPVIWEYIKAYTENTLGYQIDYNCTVLQYLAYESIALKIEESRRKHIHGKEDRE